MATTGFHWRLFGLSALGLGLIWALAAPKASACAECSVDPQGGPPSPPPFNPSLPRAHDPAIAKEGKRWYVFTTGPGIPMMSSEDQGKTWKALGSALDPVPAWTATTIPGSRNFYWAPDLQKWDGKWRLYYSVSTFGKNRSAIGLATNTTLDPSKKGYGWKDEGIVIESYPTDDHNAIDPNVVLDAAGTPWLSWGSFWSGIKMIRLERSTGKPERHQLIQSLAARDRKVSPPNEIEAPFILRRGKFFYLFVSWDICCRGVNSTYNIRVGRSRKVEGPYLDEAGKAMVDGGGTLVLAGDARWKGTGHNSVLRDGRTDWLVHHAYDAEDRGAPKLRIEKIVWTKAGWPSVGP